MDEKMFLREQLFLNFPVTYYIILFHLQQNYDVPEIGVGDLCTLKLLIYFKYTCYVYIYVVYFATCIPKAGIVKSEWTSIARQLLHKLIPAATNTQAAIE
jgi:hypothetical protein